MCSLRAGHVWRAGWVERLEQRISFAAGDPDPAFGLGGLAVTGPAATFWSSVVVQPDGKVLRAGTYHPADGDADFVIERYDADGSPDPSFGSGGRVTTDFLGTDDYAVDLSLLPDGRIVARGLSGSTTFAAARYNPDGSPDPTFGVAGRFVADARLPHEFQFYDTASAWTADGKYVEAGLANFTGPRLVLRRFNADGSPDPTWGAGGQTVSNTPWGGGDTRINQLLVDADGRVTVVGHYSETSRHFLLRFRPDGSPDPTFGVGGAAGAAPAIRAPADSSFPTASQVARLLPDGSTLVLSWYGGAYPGYGPRPTSALTRYRPDGTPDPSFGTGGTQVTDRTYSQPSLIVFADGTYSIVDPGGPVAFYPDGRSVVDVGGTLTRYEGAPTADATADPTFVFHAIPDPSPAGAVGPVYGVFNDVAVQPDGKAVAVGQVNVGDWIVARFNPDGTPDPSFGAGGTGRVTLDFAAAGSRGSYDVATSVLVLPDGRIVVGGYAHAPEWWGDPQRPDFALARLNPDGSLDASFGAGGTVTTDLAGGSDRILRLALQPDGGVVALGTSQPASAADPSVIVRYLPDGAVDPAFGVGGVIWSGDELADVAVEPDGRIVAAGTAVASGGGTDYLVLRYTPGGLPDPTFGMIGRATVDVGTGPGVLNPDVAAAVAVQPDGRILVGGSNGIIRLTAAGAPDLSFARDGRATAGLAVLPDASVIALLGNPSYVDGQTRLAHLLPDGEADLAFVTAGLVERLAPGRGFAAHAIAVGPDGNVLVAGAGGYTYAGSAALARVLTPAGTTPAVHVPRADGWTDAARPDDAHGSDPVLSTHLSGAGDRVAYLRFDLGRTSGPTSAVLRLVGRLSGAADHNVRVSVYAVDDPDWSEATLTDRTRPVFGEAARLATFAVTDGASRTYAVDLSDYVRALRAAGRSQVVLAIRPDAATDGAVTFASRESVSGAPQLVVTTAGVPAPAGLVADAPGAHEVDLRWTDASDNEDGFLVESGSPRDGWFLVATLPADTTRYVDYLVPSPYGADPAAYGSRTYRVRAFNRDATSGPSNAATVTLPRTLPVNVTRIDDPTGSRHVAYFQVDLSGYADPSVAVLRVFGDVTGGPAAGVPVSLRAVDGAAWSADSWAWTWDDRPATGPVITTTTVTGASPEQWHLWDLAAYARAELAAGRTVLNLALAWEDGTGGGTFRPLFSYRTLYEDVLPQLDLVAHLAPAPAAPVALAATGLDATYAYLAWPDVAGELEYVVESSQNGTDFLPDGFTLGRDVTSVLATGTPGTTTYYRVRARNYGGVSDPSPVVRVDFPPAADTRRAAALGDAYVDAVRPGENFARYGLPVSGRPGDPAEQVAYLKFDVSAFPRVGSAYLWLTGPLGTGASSFTASVHPVADTTWTQDSLTWSDRPAVGNVPLATNTVRRTGQWYGWGLFLFDVSSYVRAARAAGQTTVSFAVRAGSAGSAYFFSAEDYNSNPLRESPALFISPDGPPPIETVPLTGTPIGTPGSWHDAGNDLTKALDGDPSTFFDAPTSVAAVGLDLGAPKTLAAVRFLPRPGLALRMVGGRFEGSNVGPHEGFVDLAAITDQPADDAFTTLAIADATPFRYVRYVGPDGGWGNAAELQFLGAGNTELNAPVYLSDLAWISAANGYGPVERDASNGEWGRGDGHPLTLGGVTYAKGLGVHADSDLLYQLGGGYSTFLADIGVDDEVAPNGSVTFRVFADGDLLYDSGVMTNDSPVRSIRLDVTGRQQLRLVVTGAGDGYTADHADWANARLLRRPAPAPAAASALAPAAAPAVIGVEPSTARVDGKLLNADTPPVPRPVPAPMPAVAAGRRTAPRASRSAHATAAVRGPTRLRRGQVGTFRFSVMGSQPGGTAHLIYLIDWNGDGTVDQTLAGRTAGGATATHRFKTAGVFNLTVTIAEASSGRAIVTGRFPRTVT